MRRFRAVALAVPLALCVALHPGAEGVESMEGAEVPAELLERLGRVALLYEDSALRFTCEETVYFTAGGLTDRGKYLYLYRRDEEGRLVDRRRRLERGSRLPEGAPPADPGEELGLPEFLTRAYSWVSVFHPSNQALHDYVLESDDRAAGRPAHVIRFRARPPFRDGSNVWAGRAWVDRESAQILKVVAVRAESAEENERLEQALDGTLVVPPGEDPSMILTHFETLFDVEHNGMRFPGRVRIWRRWYNVHGSPADGGTVTSNPVHEVTQLYKRYRFFFVRTREEIRGFVDDGVTDRPGPPRPASPNPATRSRNR